MKEEESKRGRKQERERGRGLQDLRDGLAGGFKEVKTEDVGARERMRGRAIELAVLLLLLLILLLLHGWAG